MAREFRINAFRVPDDLEKPFKLRAAEHAPPGNKKDKGYTKLLEAALRDYLEKPSPANEGVVAAMASIERSAPGLAESLLALGRAATRRPQLARALSALAEEARGDAPGENAARFQTGKRPR